MSAAEQGVKLLLKKMLKLVKGGKVNNAKMIVTVKEKMDLLLFTSIYSSLSRLKKTLYNSFIFLNWKARTHFGQQKQRNAIVVLL